VIFPILQQSKQVRRISADDAAAASHTAQAVRGSLPSSSAAASTDREPTATTEPAADSNFGSTKVPMQSQAPSLVAKPKTAPAVTVKPKAPSLVVRAKRKADDAEQNDLQPDKKQHQIGTSSADAGAGGLAGLAAYGSDSGSGNASDS